MHDMNSKTDYRKLARHHRGLYFVTPSREEVRRPPARCSARAAASLGLGERTARGVPPVVP